MVVGVQGQSYKMFTFRQRANPRLWLIKPPDLHAAHIDVAMTHAGNMVEAGQSLGKLKLIGVDADLPPVTIRGDG